MTNTPLKTYLRTFRRRTCLSQDEVAFLLGGLCGTSVSRHEQGIRTPLLESLLAYTYIFKADLPTLYDGLYVEVQDRIRVRARGLCRSLERQPQCARRDYKIKLLQELLSADEPNSGSNQTTNEKGT